MNLSSERPLGLFVLAIRAIKFSSPNISKHKLHKLWTSCSSIEIKIKPESESKFLANFIRGTSYSTNRYDNDHWFLHLYLPGHLLLFAL